MAKEEKPFASEATTTSRGSPAADTNHVGATAMLNAVNSASDKVAVLHLAFIAVCAYVLVVVFSTTDMDLLIGKGVKLPVVDVEVLIIGFYLAAPYLVVLVHFNLLLQLQLLSGKIYAFDDIAPREKKRGGLRDQMSIFPYNYYLIGHHSQAVSLLIAVLVSISMLILPLAVLLALQTRFLAYQSEVVTWSQRVAVLLDIALVVTLWPEIMDPEGSWRSYMSRLKKSIRARALEYLFGFFGIGFLVGALLSQTSEVTPTSDLLEGRPFWIAISLFGIAAGIRLWRVFRPPAEIEAKSWPAKRVRGLGGFTVVLSLGLLLPFLLTTVGERLDRDASFVAVSLHRLRHLDLSNKRLFAKLPDPATLTALLSQESRTQAGPVSSVEPVDLQGRSLRGANFRSAVMMKARLQNAQLQNAILAAAHLEGADLGEADLRDAQLQDAVMYGADLVEVKADAAIFFGTQLAGANLDRAELRGAVFVDARLDGANLENANLVAAHLHGASLIGANLSNAHLRAADLGNCNLQGANLEGSELTGAVFSRAVLYFNKKLLISDLIDARGIRWEPFSERALKLLKEQQSVWAWVPPRRMAEFIANTEAAMKPGPKPEVLACVRDITTGIECKNVYSFGDFHELFVSELIKETCELPPLLQLLTVRLARQTPASPTELLHKRTLAARLSNALKGPTKFCSAAGGRVGGYVSFLDRLAETQ